jgi:hypothetical protein
MISTSFRSGNRYPAHKLLFAGQERFEVQTGEKTEIDLFSGF